MDHRQAETPPRYNIGMGQVKVGAPTMPAVSEPTAAVRLSVASEMLGGQISRISAMLSRLHGAPEEARNSNADSQKAFPLMETVDKFEGQIAYLAELASRLERIA